MAVWSVIGTSGLEGPKRLDPEYYRPEYLEAERRVAAHEPLRQYIVKIIHPTEVRRVYAERGLRILLAQDVRRNFLDFSDSAFMPENAKRQIARNQLFENDV